LNTLKVGFIISLIAASVGFVNYGDTAARENNDVAKLAISKDADPNIKSVIFNEMGVMTASWYGPHFHGKLTSNGELYNQMAHTAASKTMPFGTILQVTNNKNGKSVIVRINDRGPFMEGRDLDLSKGTALALGMIERGVIKVKVQELVLNTYSNQVNTLN